MATSCQNCGHALLDDGHVDSTLRTPCDVCGSTSRAYTLSLEPGRFAITGNDAVLKHDGFIGRQKQLKDFAGFVKDGFLVAVVGETGVGKTSLLRRLIEEQGYTEWEWIRAAERGATRRVFDLALKEDANRRRPSLVIIDDCEYLSEGDLAGLLEELYRTPAVHCTFLLTTKDFALPRRNPPIRYYHLRPWYEALKSDSVADGLTFDLHATGEDSSRARSHIILLGSSLLERLQSRPGDVYELKPRQFEELIADLLVDQGCEVELTPQTRDGGKDLIASMNTPIGNVLTLVETKRYRQDRTIGVGLVRQLYGVLHDHTASHAMFVTTSSFTKDSREFQNRHSYEMSLREYSDVKTWINNFRGN